MIDSVRTCFTNPNRNLVKKRNFVLRNSDPTINNLSKIGIVNKSDFFFLPREKEIQWKMGEWLVCNLFACFEAAFVTTDLLAWSIWTHQSFGLVVIECDVVQSLTLKIGLRNGKFSYAIKTPWTTYYFWLCWLR